MSRLWQNMGVTSRHNDKKIWQKQRKNRPKCCGLSIIIVTLRMEVPPARVASRHRGLLIKRASSGFLIHVNLARFPEPVKSWRTMSTSRIGAWAASAALLIRVVQEPTWARRTDVGLRPFSLFPKITTHPNLWNYEHDKPSAGIAILKVSLSH